MLQVYQADLLKDLDDGQSFSPDAVAELRHTMDIVLRTTKQTASAFGCSMAEIVERHLWFYLAGIGRKESNFLLYAPVSLSELF